MQRISGTAATWRLGRHGLRADTSRHHDEHRPGATTDGSSPTRSAD